jgi:hypothetical protein
MCLNETLNGLQALARADRIAASTSRIGAAQLSLHPQRLSGGKLSSILRVDAR